jgi:hypothetical protein
MKALLKHRTGEKGITHYSLSLQQMFSFFPEHLLIARDAAKFAPISMPVADSFGQRGCWCKFGTEGGHLHHSTLLLRRGKEPKNPFAGLHLLPLLLALLLLQLLSKN